MSSDGYPGGWQETSRRGRRAKPDSEDWENEQGSYPQADYYPEPGYRDSGYSEPGSGTDPGWNRSVYQTDPRGGRTDPNAYYDQPDSYGGRGDYAGGSGYDDGGGYAEPYGGGEGTYQAADPYANGQPYDNGQSYDSGQSYDNGQPYDDRQGYGRGSDYNGYGGYDAGAQPGYDTGAQSGYDTGTQPGYDTGTQPGYDSGAQPGYDTVAQPGYDYRDDSYAGQPGYDRGGPYDDYSQAGSGPVRAYRGDDRYAADDDPSGWRGQQGGIGAPGNVGGGYEPVSQRERGYQRGAAGEDRPLGGSRRSGRGMQADEDRHSGFFSGFPGEEEDVNYGRKRRRGIGAGMIALIIFVVVILGIGGVGYHYYSEYQSRHASYSGSGFGTVDIIVKPGDSFDTIAPQLLSKGVIAAIDPWDSFVADKPDALQPGEFKLHEHMSPALAWALLVNPKSKVDSNVTIVDGRRVSLILANLAADTGIPLSQFQAAAKETSKLGLPSFANGNLEGYLYPATYPYVPGSTTALQILQMAVHEFSVVTGSINLAAGARHAQFSEEQVITEASLLEAEVGPKYYKDVARTLDNRLIDNMPLQLDSTVAYATGKYIYALTSSDLHVNSPYNTFLHTNLPPGPIDSPDVTAINAVLHPAPSSDNWIYFVTVNKAGLTLFTNSASQFQTWSQEAKNNGL
jgi:UPF0755 protein